MATRFEPDGPTMRIRTTRDMDGADRTTPYPVCSFCGSMDVETVLRLLATPGTRYSGCDWQYGWPHKFYVEMRLDPPQRRCTSSKNFGPENERLGYSDVTHEFGKFYAVHLLDATPEQFAEWKRVAVPLLGVDYEIGPNGLLRWGGVPGHQASGVVA